MSFFNKVLRSEYGMWIMNLDSRAGIYYWCIKHLCLQHLMKSKTYLGEVIL